MPKPRVLVARFSEAKYLKGDYRIGWLHECSDGFFWMIFGSSATKEHALMAVEDLVQRKGYCQVFVDNKPFGKHVTFEQMESLIENNMRLPEVSQ